MSGRIAYYGGIIKEGLVLNLDAAKQDSYPRYGTNWYDLSGNGYNGILTNGPVYTTDAKGSIIFDGTNDYVDCGVANLTPGTDITTDVLLRLDGIQSSYADIIDYSHAGPPGLGGFVVQQDAGSTSNAFYFAWWNGISDFDFCNFQVPIDNTYFHLCITKNLGNVIVYIDGVSLYTGTGASYLGGSGRVIHIGNNTAGYGRHIKGAISTVRIYNRALTSQEVLQNFNTTKARFGL